MTAKFWHTVHPSAGSLRTHQECFKTQAPCRGDAFVFVVTVRELWTYRGDFDRFDLDARKESQRAELGRRLRAVSRRYPPEATVAFEHTMNVELAAAEFANDSKFSCAYSVQVAPDDGLVKHMRDTALNQLEVDAAHNRSARHLDQLEEMQARWLAFLKHLDDDPLGQIAAKLAGDKDLADAIKQHASDQQRIFEDLRELFDTATAVYRDMDVFDLVMTTDSALSRLLRHIRADGTPSPNGSKPAGE